MNTDTFVYPVTTTTITTNNSTSIRFAPTTGTTITVNPVNWSIPSTQVTPFQNIPYIYPVDDNVHEQWSFKTGKIEKYVRLSLLPQELIEIIRLFIDAKEEKDDI